MMAAGENFYRPPGNRGPGSPLEDDNRIVPHREPANQRLSPQGTIPPSGLLSETVPITKKVTVFG